MASTLCVSLDESAYCLLKLLLEQQQSLTLRVPVCLISCCHFSSRSLVNHLSRSPLCNQLNLVIEWRKLKNAARRRFRQSQKKKKNMPASRACGFRGKNWTQTFMCVFFFLLYVKWVMWCKSPDVKVNVVTYLTSWEFSGQTLIQHWGHQIIY